MKWLLIDRLGRVIGRITNPGRNGKAFKQKIPVVGTLTDKTTPADFQRFAEKAREINARTGDGR